MSMFNFFIFLYVLEQAGFPGNLRNSGQAQGHPTPVQFHHQMPQQPSELSHQIPWQSTTLTQRSRNPFDDDFDDDSSASLASSATTGISMQVQNIFLSPFSIFNSEVSASNSALCRCIRDVLGVEEQAQMRCCLKFQAFLDDVEVTVFQLFGLLMSQRVFVTHL